MYIQFSPMRSNELKIVYEYSSDNCIGDLVISADREISTSELDLISQKIKEKANNRKKKNNFMENNPKKKSEAITFTKNEKVVENKSQKELDIIQEIKERNNNWAETKQKQRMEEKMKNEEIKKKLKEDVQRKKNIISRKKRKEKEREEKEQEEKEQQKKLSQGPFGQYYSERIIIDVDSTLDISNLYKDCKEWYANNANVKCPPSCELTDNMDKMYRKNVRGKWKGIAINDGNDEDDENDEDIYSWGDVCDQQPPSPRTRYLQLRLQNA